MLSFLLKEKDKYRYQLQSGWPRQSGSVLIKKLSVVSYKQNLQTVYSLRFDHVLYDFFFFSVLLFMCPAWLRNEKVPKSMISMTKAFNIWLAA